MNEQYILSAAHCANKPTHVLVKEHNRTDGSDGQTVVEICNWTVYENYETIPLPRSDFALASLKEPIAFDDKATPACLPTSEEMREDNFFVGKALTVSGWGRLGIDLGLSDVLMKLYVTAPSNEDCAKVWDIHVANVTIPVIQPEMICADGKKEKPTQTVCMGDSGGPLTYTNQRNVTTVVGVASFVRRDAAAGKACLPGYPAVFARVTSVLDWIIQETHKDVGQCSL